MSNKSCQSIYTLINPSDIGSGCSGSSTSNSCILSIQHSHILWWCLHYWDSSCKHTSLSVKSNNDFISPTTWICSIKHNKKTVNEKNAPFGQRKMNTGTAGGKTEKMWQIWIMSLWQTNSVVWYALIHLKRWWIKFNSTGKDATFRYRIYWNLWLQPILYFLYKNQWILK